MRMNLEITPDFLVIMPFPSSPETSLIFFRFWARGISFLYVPCPTKILTCSTEPECDWVYAQHLGRRTAVTHQLISYSEHDQIYHSSRHYCFPWRIAFLGGFATDYSTLPDKIWWPRRYWKLNENQFDSWRWVWNLPMFCSEAADRLSSLLDGWGSGPPKGPPGIPPGIRASEVESPACIIDGLSGFRTAFKPWLCEIWSPATPTFRFNICKASENEEDGLFDGSWTSGIGARDVEESDVISFTFEEASEIELPFSSSTRTSSACFASFLWRRMRSTKNRVRLIRWGMTELCAHRCSHAFWGL